MVAIAKVETHWLTKGKMSYRFTRQGEDVTVAYVTAGRRDFYVMPRDEARHLYASLKRQGYTRF